MVFQWRGTGRKVRESDVCGHEMPCVRFLEGVDEGIDESIDEGIDEGIDVPQWRYGTCAADS